MATDREVIAFALRRLAEEVADNRPKMADRMRQLAGRHLVALTEDERSLLLELVEGASAVETGAGAGERSSPTGRAELAAKLNQA